MNNVVINPYEYFADPTKGRPIFNGSIFIGEPDTDPEVPANQKQVYARQENGTEVAIPQPITTNAGGYPTYNGSVIAIVVNGPHSLKVNNKDGSQILYSSNNYNGVATTEDYGSVLLATDAQAIAGTPNVIPDAEQVRKNHVAQVSTVADLRNLEPAFDGQQVELLGHIIAGIGGGTFYADYGSSAADDNGATIVTVVGRRWVRKLGDFVSPAMFGAAQDGVTGDSAAINAFLSSGYNLVGEEGTELLLDSPITIPQDICFDANYSKWIKGFNGDSIEKFGRRSIIKNLEIDGNGINYSGCGVVIDIGGRANYEDLGQQKMFNCTLRNSRNREVDYVGAYRGTLSQLVGCKFFPLPVSDGGGGVAVSWPNEPVGNGNRHIRDCYCAGVLLFDQGCDNGIVAFNTVGATTTQPSVILNNDSKKMIFLGNRFAHGATDFVIAGSQHSFVGNIFSSTVSFSSTAFNVSFDSSNVCGGLSTVPTFGKNNIDIGELSSTYPIGWSTDGTQPAFGNADVRALYKVRGRFVRVSVQIAFGSTTTFGTGSYTFTLPPVNTTATKLVTGSGWLRGHSLTALASPVNGTVTLYYNAVMMNNTSPVTLTNGDLLIFDIEYEVQ